MGKINIYDEIVNESQKKRENIETKEILHNLHRKERL